MEKNMHEGHRENVRKRFRAEGLTHFEDHNALELLLFYALARVDTNELAHSLLDTFGSLSGVFDAPLEDLMQVKGVGEKTAVLIKLMPELHRKYVASLEKPKPVIKTTQDAVHYFKPLLMHLPNEKYMAICLDNAGKVVKTGLLAEGTVNKAQVEKRKVMELVHTSHASAIIVAHNHPYGLLKPSNDDLTMTQDLKTFLKQIDVTLNDHLIFAGDRCLSLRDHPDWNIVFA